MCRQDIISRIHRLTPLDVDLRRLIVYETNGTSTGHALDLPNHPGAVAQNHPLLEFALARHGVTPEFNDRRVACVNIGAEAGTVMFPNVFAVWNNAGFAKVNINPSVWTAPQASDFLADLQPQFLTGDPIAFSELARWGIDYRPSALISTATTLASELQTRLQQCYQCPVIDFYSTTETGPIAFSASDGEGLSLIAPDLFIEILDEAGYPLPPGELGEITVSGGRNPYLPLLRYRTGDFARLATGNALDPTPRLVDLHARKPVLFRDAAGATIHPLDISTMLRHFPWSQHELLQAADASLHLTIKPGLGQPLDQRALRQAFTELFGKLPLEITPDPHLGEDRPGGKVIAFRSELTPGIVTVQPPQGRSEGVSPS
jgi:phenylacetate-CoA ligase